ncbi:MAG TPA: hypothetical protein VHP11_05255, partial [Tepidisphaeraceae bacterium]|nr:hypothetical protein [Tepidisphaeraceae bacterium]
RQCSYTMGISSGPSSPPVSRCGSAGCRGKEMGQDCYASPAISQGQLFIRTTTTLFCIGKR